ncbi:hypothetical protein MTO96_046216 [Rhipicephalus appendiculatus]
MQRLVLIALVAVAYAKSTAEKSGVETTEKNPDWADEKKFGPYQKAWNTINETNVDYFLVSATYDEDSGLGGRFSCLTVKTTSITSEEDKTVAAVMTYKDRDGNM